MFIGDDMGNAGGENKKDGVLLSSRHHVLLAFPPHLTVGHPFLVIMRSN